MTGLNAVALVIPLAIVVVVLLVVAAVFMATFNATMKYLAKTYNFQFKQEISYVESLAVVVLLGIVGSLMFKSLASGNVNTPLQTYNY